MANMDNSKYAASAVAPRLKAVAKREVIIAAGALNTPKLLQLSGIGDSRLLSRFGIETLVDLPGGGCFAWKYFGERLCC
jgi:choline dehydrogenase